MPDVAKNLAGNGRNAKRNAKPLVVGALPARRRTEARTGSPQLITLAAVLADTGARRSGLIRAATV